MSFIIITRFWFSNAPKNLLTIYPANNPKNGNIIDVVSMCVDTTLATDFSFFRLTPFVA